MKKCHFVRMSYQSSILKNPLKFYNVTETKVNKEEKLPGF